MKKVLKVLLTSLLIICMCMSLTNPILLNVNAASVSQNGDPNALQEQSGLGNGGTMNDQAPGNINISCGIRVSVINKVTGMLMGHSADYLNDPDALFAWFEGKRMRNVDRYHIWHTINPYCNNKIYYMGGGTPYLDCSEYEYAGIPPISIFNTSIDEIKDFYRRNITQDTIRKQTECGLTLDELQSGRYKILIEPLGGCICGGKACILTATEYAILDRSGQIPCGDIIRTFTHRKVPICASLEHNSNFNDPNDNLNLRMVPYEMQSRLLSKTGSPRSNENIIEYLGMHLVSFRDEGEEITPPPVEVSPPSDDEAVEKH